MSNVRKLFEEKMVPVTVVRAEYVPQELKDQIFEAALHVCVLYGNGDLCPDDESTPDTHEALDYLSLLVGRAERHCPTEQRLMKVRKQN